MKPQPSSFARRYTAAGALIFGLTVAWVHAQEFTAFGGSSAAHGLRFDSYSWMLDYRQGVFNRWDASLTWINEGHFAADSIIHHRDGLAAQGWYDVPIPSEHFGFSLGAGADYYFDSQQIAAESRNFHRFAALASADLKYYFDPAGRWLLRLRISEIAPARAPDHLLVDFGVGHYFGKTESRHVTELPTWREAVLNNDAEPAFPPELTVLTGVSRINTFARLGSNCQAIEYREGWKPHVEWSAGYLYEGKTSVLRRSGLTMESWVMSDSVPRDAALQIGIGLGFGTYANLSAHHQPPGAANTAVPLFAGLVTPTVFLRFHHHWTGRIEWHRVVTSYNTDADVWLVGVGYHWR